MFHGVIKYRTKLQERVNERRVEKIITKGRLKRNGTCGSYGQGQKRHQMISSVARGGAGGAAAPPETILAKYGPFRNLFMAPKNTGIDGMQVKRRLRVAYRSVFALTNFLIGLRLQLGFPKYCYSVC